MAIISAKQNTSPTWTYGARGSAGQHALTRNSSIAWVVYMDENATTGNILAAYTTDGVTWIEETVAVGAECYAQYGGLNIMLDSSGVPRIIYYYEPLVGFPEIRYVDRAGGAWNAPETVVVLAGIRSWTRACIDAVDDIHITWDDSGTIEYITGHSGAWGASQTVYAGITRFLDIAVNSSAEAVILCSFGQATYTRIRIGGVWQAPETVELTDGYGLGRIAIDGNDDLHVVWNSEEWVSGDYSVFYRKQESGAWLARQTIVTDVDDWAVGICIDSSNNAYVIYQEGQGAADETVYYRKVVNGITMGAVEILTNTIFQPSGDPSVLDGLNQTYPSGNRQIEGPSVTLFDEDGLNSDLYYYGPAFITAPVAGTLSATGVT